MNHHQITCKYSNCPVIQDSQLKKHWCGCLGVCEKIEELYIQDKSHQEILFIYR